MSERPQTVAGAYDKIAAHEELCAERYRGINEKLTWVMAALVTLVLGFVGWAAVQLYTLEPLRVAAAARVQTEASEARAVVRDAASEARSELRPMK